MEQEKQGSAANIQKGPIILSRSNSKTSFESHSSFVGNQAIDRKARQEVVQEIGQLAGNKNIQRLIWYMKWGPKPKLGKKIISKSISISLIRKVFGKYRKIKGGKVLMLSQAEFQKAWDKIHGKTKYSWVKYVIPKYGNLEGFASKGVNYINKSIGSPDVIIHEMLHSNEAPNWNDFAGANIVEGSTEYFTQLALKAGGYPPVNSYPNQRLVISYLVRAVGKETLIQAYFNGKTAELKAAVDSRCTGSWDQFKKAMDESKWINAVFLLRRKSKQAGKQGAK